MILSGYGNGNRAVVDSRIFPIEQKNNISHRKVAMIALGALGALMAYFILRNLYANNDNVPFPHTCSADIIPQICRAIQDGEVYLVSDGECRCPPGMIRKRP